MWKSAIFLCLLAAACSAAPPKGLRSLRPRTGGRIVGGEPVDISQYPWQVSLQQYGSHDCGGSIIGASWVLTAAHCLTFTSDQDLSIRAGTSTRESGGSVFPVQKSTVHKNYSYFESDDYDVAVILISGSFSFGSNVQAVSLAESEPAAGTRVSISGWGDLTSGGWDSPIQLQAVTTSIVSRESCRGSYGEERITERMICAGEAQGGKDSCQGDSGGPLVAGSTQYGIVSWGNECALPGYPGVYTNVAAVRSWISDKTGV